MADVLHGNTKLTGPEKRHGLESFTTSEDILCRDLALTLGASRSTTAGPFTGGTLFTPRVWNGTIYYTVAPAPEPTSLVLVGIAGCLSFAIRKTRRGKPAA